MTTLPQPLFPKPLLPYSDRIMLDLALPRTREAPGLARQAVEQEFAGDLSERAIGDARLVVSELVTNAITHGEGAVVLKAALEGGILRIEVVDEGTGEAPAIRERGADELGGRGLRIVDTVSVRWGAFEGTTHVWAELRSS